MISMSRHGRLAKRRIRRHFHRHHIGKDAQPSKPQQWFSGRLSAVLFPSLIAAVLVAMTHWANPGTVVQAWSIIASPAILAALFGIVLTAGVCGTLASGAIWWVCQRELRASQRLQAAMREFLAKNDQGQSDANQRQTA